MLSVGPPTARIHAMLTVLLLSLCPAVAPPVRPADLILHGGKVVTLDKKSSIAQAVAVRDGRIVAVGTDAVATAAGAFFTPVVALTAGA